MDNATFNKIKKDLTNQKDELLKVIYQTEDLRANDMQSNEGPKDSVDEANDDANEQTRQALSIKEAERLNQIESALTRMHNGVYGNCLECHNPIAPMRLEVQPFAAYCRDCQEKIEKRSRG